jgi:hypothetical protein
MKLPPGYVPGGAVQKATAFGGFGQKLMEQMGWEKGKGLGVGNIGITEAIEVKKKEDTAGVGTGMGCCALPYATQLNTCTYVPHIARVFYA